MHWFTTLSQTQRAYRFYVPLLQVAILSAKKHTSLIPYVIFDGEPDGFTKWLKRQGVEVLFHRSRLLKDIISLAQQTNDPTLYEIAAGACLRIDLPSLLSKSPLRDSRVLYTDVDVLFQKDPVPLLSRWDGHLLSGSSQSLPGDYVNLNSGVLLMNIPELLKWDSQFLGFCRRYLPIASRVAWDQTLYRAFFRFPHGSPCWDPLDEAFNWKPYWGVNPEASIIHFHGPKPTRRMEIPPNHRDFVNRSFYHYAQSWDRWAAMLPRPFEIPQSAEKRIAQLFPTHFSPARKRSWREVFTQKKPIPYFARF